ncbi:hypothetical protein VTO42DRAFT_7452 [Malbranchea cinnamomea]
MASASSSQNLLRPPTARPYPSSPQKPGSSSSVPRPPLSVHPTATVSEVAYFQGTHPISVGAGTIIHPRAKLLSFEGPINIGEGCIIGEKCVIGGGSATHCTTNTQAAPGASPNRETSEPTILENSVLVGPLATISAGAHIRSAATVDASASLGRNVRIGKHAKVCPSCYIPDNEVVDDWIVIWGGSAGITGGLGLQRRKRPSDGGNDLMGGLGGRDVESARLIVLNRERDCLTKLIGVGTGTRRR